MGNPIPNPTLQALQMDFLGESPHEVAWWACCLVHSAALERFYSGLGLARLSTALQHMMADARTGLDLAGGRRLVSPSARFGEAAGTAAIVSHGPGAELAWWKAGAQHSFGLAAVFGLPGGADPMQADIATRHHRAWRSGLMLVVPEPEWKASLNEITGYGAGPFLDLVARQYLARVTPTTMVPLG